LIIVREFGEEKLRIRRRNRMELKESRSTCRSHYSTLDYITNTKTT
jgi:hypothetical protein